MYLPKKVLVQKFVELKKCDESLTTLKISLSVQHSMFYRYVNLSLFFEIKITPENSFRVLLLLALSLFLEATKIKIRVSHANKVLAAEHLLCEQKFMH
jgi:hypothetical protein